MYIQSKATRLVIFEERRENFGDGCTLEYILFSSAPECKDGDVYSMSVTKNSSDGADCRAFVYDVTRNAAKAHEIFTSLADGLVSPIGFRDVIEDLIVE